MGADAMFWNPANVARAQNGVDILASHMTYIADINVIYAAVAVKAGSFGSIGVSVKSLDVGKILKTTVQNPDGTGQTYEPQHIVLGANWSKEITDQISVGFNINYVSETLDLVSASGFAFDFGVTYADLGGIEGLDMAVALKNFGADMKFDGSGLWLQATNTDQRRGEQFYKVDAASFALPTSFDIALGYEVKFGDANVIQLSGVYTNNNFYPEQYKFGLEYGFDDFLFARVGYNHTEEYESSDVLFKYALGVGIKYNVGVDLRFDYTYLPAEYMRDTHFITLGIGI